MKPVVAVVLLVAVAAAGYLLTRDSPALATYKDATVEASCGQCQFGMEGEGCTLAVRLYGEGLYVEGTDIDDHGDAHAADGFCEMVREARVTGEVRDGKFHAEAFALLPQE